MIVLTMIILHVSHNNHLNVMREELIIVKNNGLIDKSFEDLAVC